MNLNVPKNIPKHLCKKNVKHIPDRNESRKQQITQKEHKVSHEHRQKK